MKIECPVCRKVLECESEWCGQKAQCPFCKNKFVITEIMLNTPAAGGGSKWRCVWPVAAAVLCLAAGLGLGRLLFGPGGVFGLGRTTATENAPVSATTGKSAVAAEKSAATTGKAAVAAAAVTDENNIQASRTNGKSSEETTTAAAAAADESRTASSSNSWITAWRRRSSATRF